MKKKILELEKKLSSLKGEVDIKTNLENKNSNPAIGVGIKISVDFVSTIVVGVLNGLGIDKLLDTKPIFFIIFFILNENLYDNNKYTLYIIHAALLTIWYTELAFYLEKYFWRDFLQNQLPFSINLLLSFVLMINAGYFTLMFIIRILETSRLY